MLKKILFLVILINNIYAENVTLNLEANKWYLLGTPVDTSLDSLNLSGDAVVWQYKNGLWSVNKVTQNYLYLNSLSAGDAFWIYSLNSEQVTLNNIGTSSPLLNRGWSMYSPYESAHIEDIFTNNQVLNIAWGFKNNEWKVWINDRLGLNNNYEVLEEVFINEGLWVYLNDSYQPVIQRNYVNIGEETSRLSGGVFENIIKSSSSNIEDIWNISFKINSRDISEFNIGIKFIKQSSGAIGEVAFTGLSIQNNEINNPSYIIVKGVNSNGESGQTYFNQGYNPDNILNNAVILNEDTITLKLGTIMKTQNIVDEITFKAVSIYDIQINSDNLEILESKIIDLGNITNFSFPNKFVNKNGIEGSIEIR